jgi:hypothetical protein
VVSSGRPDETTWISLDLPAFLRERCTYEQRVDDLRHLITRTPWWRTDTVDGQPSSSATVASPCRSCRAGVTPGAPLVTTCAGNLLKADGSNERSQGDQFTCDKATRSSWGRLRSACWSCRTWRDLTVQSHYSTSDGSDGRQPRHTEYKKPRSDMDDRSFAASVNLLRSSALVALPDHAQGGRLSAV